MDILQNQTLIRQHFPQFDPAIQAIIHIRGGGDIIGQQLGSLMLEYLGEVGCTRRKGVVTDIAGEGPYTLHLQDGDPIKADQVVKPPVRSQAQLPR